MFCVLRRGSVWFSKIGTAAQIINYCVRGRRVDFGVGGEEPILRVWAPFSLLKMRRNSAGRLESTTVRVFSQPNGVPATPEAEGTPRYTYAFQGISRRYSALHTCRSEFIVRCVPDA